MARLRTWPPRLPSPSSPTNANRPDVLERWFSEDIDVRHDPVVGEQIQAFLRQHQARSVVVTDRVISCPHEEGTRFRP